MRPRHLLRRTLLSLLLAGIPFGFASAAPITMQFTATGFAASAPQSTVSGTIRWNAASPNDPVDALTAIDLTIAGHTYTLPEIGFFPDPSNLTHVGFGGLPTFGITPTDDFAMLVFLDSLTSALFAYTAGGGPTFFARSISFGVTADVTNSGEADTTDGVAVPEPATGALLGLAVGGLAVVRRRRSS